MGFINDKIMRSVTVLVGIFLGSCSSSSSDVNGGKSQGQDAEFLGGGSCSEQVQFDEEIGLPDTILEAENYFECGALESLVSARPGSMPTGSGTISLTNENLSADSAAVEFFYDGVYENHKGIQLYLHDGDIRQLDRRFELLDDTGAGVYRHEVRWGIYTARYVLSVELASFAPDQFNVGNFEFVETENLNDPAYAETNAMFRASVFYDRNGNGRIDSLDEIIDVESGHVTITGERPDWSISVDIMLSNGDSMTGQYAGDYIEIPVAIGYEP